jgi:hypothetical protein
VVALTVPRPKRNWRAIIVGVVIVGLGLIRLLEIWAGTARIP